MIKNKIILYVLKKKKKDLNFRYKFLIIMSSNLTTSFTLMGALVAIHTVNLAVASKEISKSSEIVSNLEGSFMYYQLLIKKFGIIVALFLLNQLNSDSHVVLKILTAATAASPILILLVQEIWLQFENTHTDDTEKIIPRFQVANSAISLAVAVALLVVAAVFTAKSM